MNDTLTEIFVRMVLPLTHKSTFYHLLTLKRVSYIERSAYHDTLVVLVKLVEYTDGVVLVTIHPLYKYFILIPFHHGVVKVPSEAFVKVIPFENKIMFKKYANFRATR